MIKDTDKGLRDLVRRAFGLRKAEVTVGILAGSGGKANEVRGESVGEPVTTLDIAIWNHFGTISPVSGTTHVPARPFISLYVDSQRPRLKEMMRVVATQVVQGKAKPLTALNRMGLKMQGEIQRGINVGWFGAYPENAEATIKAKGSATPLIDTGVLRSSITYRVRLTEGGQSQVGSVTSSTSKDPRRQKT